MDLASKSTPASALNNRAIKTHIWVGNFCGETLCFYKKMLQTQLLFCCYGQHDVYYNCCISIRCVALALALALQLPVFCMPQIVLQPPRHWSYFIVSTVSGAFMPKMFWLPAMLWLPKCSPVLGRGVCTVQGCVCCASQIKLKPLQVAISDTASWLKDMSSSYKSRSCNYN